MTLSVKKKSIGWPATNGLALVVICAQSSPRSYPHAMLKTVKVSPSCTSTRVPMPSRAFKRSTKPVSRGSGCDNSMKTRLSVVLPELSRQIPTTRTTSDSGWANGRLLLLSERQCRASSDSTVSRCVPVECSRSDWITWTRATSVAMRFIEVASDSVTRTPSFSTKHPNETRDEPHSFPRQRSRPRAPARVPGSSLGHQQGQLLR